jgi:hypothetical protein
VRCDDRGVGRARELGYLRDPRPRLAMATCERHSAMTSTRSAATWGKRSRYRFDSLHAPTRSRYCCALLLVDSFGPAAVTVAPACLGRHPLPSQPPDAARPVTSALASISA